MAFHSVDIFDNDPFTVGKCTSCGGKGSFSTTVKRTDVPKTDAQKMKDGTYEAEQQAAQAEKAAQALKELLLEKIDTFGSTTGNQNAGSIPYFTENRETYELLDAVAIM